MCLDTACVSKPTDWWENPIVSIWPSVGFRLWGPIVATVGKGADKIYYDIPLSRPSTYRGIFEEGHSSGCAGENQCDVARSRAKAKSDALDDGGTLAGVRFLIFPPFDPPLAPPEPSFRYSASRVLLLLSKRPSSSVEDQYKFMHSFYPRLHKRVLGHEY